MIFLTIREEKKMITYTSETFYFFSVPQRKRRIVMNFLTHSEVIQTLMEFRGKKKEDDSSSSESESDIEEDVEEEVELSQPPKIESGVVVLHSLQDEKEFIKKNREKKCVVIIVWDSCTFCHHLLHNLNTLSKESLQKDEYPFDRIGIINETDLSEGEKEKRKLEYFPHIRMYDSNKKSDPKMKDSSNLKDLEQLMLKLK